MSHLWMSHLSMSWFSMSCPPTSGSSMSSCQIRTLFRCSTNPHTISMLNKSTLFFNDQLQAGRLCSRLVRLQVDQSESTGLDFPPPLIFVDIGMTFGSYWGYWWVVVDINGCDCILQSVGGIRWVLSDFVGDVGWMRVKLTWTLFRLLMRRQKTKKTRTLLKCSRPSSSLKGALWRGVKW